MAQSEHHLSHNIMLNLLESISFYVIGWVRPIAGRCRAFAWARRHRNFVL